MVIYKRNYKIYILTILYLIVAELFTSLTQAHEWIESDSDLSCVVTTSSVYYLGSQINYGLPDQLSVCKRLVESQTQLGEGASGFIFLKKKGSTTCTFFSHLPDVMLTCPQSDWKTYRFIEQ